MPGSSRSDGRELKVRVEGQLVFNSIALQPERGAGRASASPTCPRTWCRRTSPTGGSSGCSTTGARPSPATTSTIRAAGNRRPSRCWSMRFAIGADELNRNPKPLRSCGLAKPTSVEVWPPASSAPPPLPDFLPWIGISICLLAGRRLSRLFCRLLRSLGLSRSAAHASTQRLHQVDHALPFRTWIRTSKSRRTAARARIGTAVDIRVPRAGRRNNIQGQEPSPRG